MKKQVLIISSDFTGHGHKSITESLLEQFYFYEEWEVRVIDGFLLGDETLLKLGKSYGPVTRYSALAWKWIWSVSGRKSLWVNRVIQKEIEENVLRLLEEIKPDLIITTHPNFNGSFLNILEKHQIYIPFVTLIADLVSISPFWIDERADYILCPTMEAKSCCLDWGVPAEKLKVFGFPIRSKFAQKPKNLQVEKFLAPHSIKCLLMSGGEGVGNMEKIAKMLIEEFDATVTIMAGRNQKLQQKLERALYPYLRDRVNICGFKDNIHEYMYETDILFTRGSPNVLMEAIATNTPVVITGALPGQEAGNPAFVVQQRMGFYCPTLDEIRKIMHETIGTRGVNLHQIKRKQREFFRPYSAEQIVSFLSMIQGTTREEVESYYAFNPIIEG